MIPPCAANCGCCCSLGCANMSFGPNAIAALFGSMEFDNLDPSGILVLPICKSSLGSVFTLSIFSPRSFLIFIKSDSLPGYTPVSDSITFFIVDPLLSSIEFGTKS